MSRPNLHVAKCRIARPPGGALGYVPACRPRPRTSDERTEHETAALNREVRKRSGRSSCFDRRQPLPRLLRIVGLKRAPVAFLDLSGEDFRVALDLVDVVVRELSPLLSNVTLQLGP